MGGDMEGGGASELKGVESRLAADCLAVDSTGLLPEAPIFKATRASASSSPTFPGNTTYGTCPARLSGGVSHTGTPGSTWIFVFSVSSFVFSVTSFVFSVTAPHTHTHENFGNAVINLQQEIMV